MSHYFYDDVVGDMVEYANVVGLSKDDQASFERMRKMAEADQAAAGASDSLADAVAKRVPKAELEKLQQSLTPLVKISLSDPVGTAKSMIAMNEKTVEFMLKFCKTPEERKAVVKASLKQYEAADKDPSTSPEVKKLFKDSAERLNKLAGADAQSFWTRPVLGPVPGWGVVAGGAGAAVGLGVLLKVLFGRR